MLQFLNVTCCIVQVYGVLTFLSAIRLKQNVGKMVLLTFSIRIAECSPVWGRAVHSVYCACLNLCVCFFSF